jgi:hypothetical protein
MLFLENLPGLVVPHESDRSQKLLLEIGKNWTIRFGKPDGLVLSIPTAVRGAAGTQ